MRKTPVMVLIPTHERPEYLKHTLSSVIEQAERFGHDVKVVVSDNSPASREENERVVEGILAAHPAFRKTVFYHYFSDRTPIERFLVEGEVEEKNAFASLAPQNGHYGASRNRLAVLAMAHAGTNARKTVFLHLDDDTPLLKGTKSDDGIKLEPHPSDLLGLFLKEHENAIKLGYEGYSSPFVGFPDGTVSGPEEQARKPPDFVRTPGIGIGQGRTLSFFGMLKPYRPFGKNEDTKLRPTLLRDFRPYAPTLIVHIGKAGVAVKEKLSEMLVAKNEAVETHAKGWKSLLWRATGQRRSLWQSTQEKYHAARQWLRRKSYARKAAS